MTLAFAPVLYLHTARMPAMPSAGFADLERFRPEVYSHLRRLLYRPELIGQAEDLTQDTFIHAFRFIESGREVTSSSAKSWLLRIATRVFLDDVRRRGRRVDPLPLDAPSADTLDGSGGMGYDLADQRDAFQQHEKPNEIARALRHLSPPHRMLLIESLQSADYKEIAAKLSISPSTVRSRLHRAREKAVYYGVLEDVVRFSELEESAKTKVLARVAALSRRFSSTKDPVDGAELTTMLGKIAA